MCMQETQSREIYVHIQLLCISKYKVLGTWCHALIMEIHQKRSILQHTPGYFIRKDYNLIEATWEKLSLLLVVENKIASTVSSCAPEHWFSIDCGLPCTGCTQRRSYLQFSWKGILTACTNYSLSKQNLNQIWMVVHYIFYLFSLKYLLLPATAWLTVMVVFVDNSKHLVDDRGKTVVTSCFKSTLTWS